MTKQPKAVRAWAGVVDDKIELKYGPSYMHDADADSAGVFKKKKDALRSFECVIPVLITPVPAKKRRSKN